MSFKLYFKFSDTQWDQIDDNQVFAPLGTHKLTIIEKSRKSQKYFFEKCWVQNGRGHIFSKNT